MQPRFSSCDAPCCTPCVRVLTSVHVQQIEPFSGGFCDLQMNSFLMRLSEFGLWLWPSLKHAPYVFCVFVERCGHRSLPGQSARSCERYSFLEACSLFYWPQFGPQGRPLWKDWLSLTKVVP